MWPIGHQKAIAMLESAIKQNALPHAFLFVGPKQIGKKTLAFAVAQALNCTTEQSPCMQCDACQRIADSKFADVSLIDLKSGGELDGGQKQRSEISIEQIRDMQHSVSLPPYEGKCKVYIIDDAENMSQSAANCMLKTLEEPNENNYFFIITSNEDMILPTVASRCQRLELKLVEEAAIADMLAKKYEMSAEEARQLAGWSAGRPGWAVRAVSNGKILEQRAESLSAILEAFYGHLEGRLKYAAALADKWAKDKDAALEEIQLWLELCRDISLHKNDIRKGIINKDREEQISDIAGKMNLADIKKVTEKVIEISGALKANVSAKLALDMMMLSLPDNKEEYA